MQDLHQKITESVKEYRKQEAALIDLVLEADFTRFYLDLGYSSLFDYLNLGQGIGAATVSNLITVARKSVIIPEMKEAIANGDVGLAKLRKVTAVINQKNKEEWIEKSKTLSCRELEKEVSKVSTYKPRRDFWQRINSEYFRLSLDVSEGFKSLANRAMDVYSKKCQTNKTLAEVFEWALKESLTKHDPLIKAERALAKKSMAKQSVTDSTLDPKSSAKQSVTPALPKIPASKTNAKPNLSVTRTSLVTDRKRKPIPQAILNQVHYRDRVQCSFEKDGKRCNHRRYLHIHHIKAVKDGGRNTAENLTTLCSLHHTYFHHQEEIERSINLIQELKFRFRT